MGFDLTTWDGYVAKRKDDIRKENGYDDMTELYQADLDITLNQ